MFGNGGGDTYSALLYTVEQIDHVSRPPISQSLDVAE